MVGKFDKHARHVSRQWRANGHGIGRGGDGDGKRQGVGGIAGSKEMDV